MNYFGKYLIISGMINTLLFNYNIHNVDIIRNKKRTKLLAMERLKYSLLAFTIGWLKLPVYIDYINVRMLKENPEDYDLIEFPKKEIEYYKIFKHI
jgi:hypothetical protein